LLSSSHTRLFVLLVSLLSRLKAGEMLHRPIEFERKAREHTQKHATITFRKSPDARQVKEVKGSEDCIAEEEVGGKDESEDGEKEDDVMEVRIDDDDDDDIDDGIDREKAFEMDMIGLKRERSLGDQEFQERLGTSRRKVLEYEKEEEVEEEE
jgi:hypothetical protein